MIDLKTILKLAAKPSTVEATRCVVFTGKSAMTMNGMDWIAGVPCEQPALTKPVAVPIAAIQKHLSKSRHLVVTPDGLTNGSNITTAFDFGKHDYAGMLDLMPKMPETKPVQFELDLDALDRVQVVAARTDVRYYLNGVLFDLTHGALVGTDGHRLHLYLNRVPQAFDRGIKDGVPTKPEVSVICPNAPLDFIVNSAQERAQVMLWDADKERQGCILINAGDAFVWVRSPIQGKFPDWQRVLPALAQRPVWAELDPVQVADAAAGVAGVYKAAGSKQGAAQLNLGAHALIANTKERDRIPLAVNLHSDVPGFDLTKLAGEMYATFYAGYLQDVADCVTEKAQWRLSAERPWNDSLLVTDGDFRGVVMPMRDIENLAPETAQAAPVAAEAAPALESAQEAPQGLPAPVKAPRLAKKARKPAQEAQEVPQVAPVAAEAAQAPESVPDAPQVAESEPVPAAVAAVAAQLVQGAQEAAKKAPRKSRKAAQAAPVAA